MTELSTNSSLITICSYFSQCSIIGICHVYTYVYFYWCMHDLRHAYVDTYAHFLSMIFQCFQNFSGSYNFMFKNSIKMYIFDLYSFVFTSRRQRTLLFTFALKKPYFSIFHTNYLIFLLTLERLPI